MDPNAQRALTPAYELVELSEDELFEQLGLRQRKIAADPSGSDRYDMQVPYDVETFGPIDDLKAFGRRYFAKVSRQAYNLMCGSGPEETEERQKIREAFGAGKEGVVAATLAGALVSAFSITPAIAAVVGALAVKIFFKPAYESMCEVWKGNLPDEPK